MNVKGEGIIAEMCQQIVEIFKPLMKAQDVDIKVCLPRPHVPNFSQYIKIAILISICWFFLILEPHAYRLRETIMKCHYPKRSKERTVWLYHHILRKRTSFLKYARRQLKKGKFKDGTFKGEQMTCWQIFRSKIDR